MPKKQPQSLIDKYQTKYPWVKHAIHLESVGMYVIEADPKGLSENPKNWRVHNQRQRSTYKAFQGKQGWLGFITFNLRTGRLLDGHMRVDEAIKSKAKFVPVILVDKSEEDENEILATLDNVGLLAQRNSQALASLVEAANKAVDTSKTKTDEAERKLAQLRKDVSEHLTSPENPTVLLPLAKTRIRAKDAADEEKSASKSKSSDPVSPPERDGYHPEVDDETFVTEVNESVLYPGLTELGIPELRDDKLATPDMAPRQTFNGEDNYSDNTYHCYSQRFDDGQNIGCIGFYIEDDKFDACYASPGSFLEFLESVSPHCLIGPDFSCYPTAWPPVMNFWNLYRSRWVTRFWQEAGFNVIPTIQVLDVPAGRETLEYVVQTLPDPTEVVSLECRKMDNDPKKAMKTLGPLLDAVCTLPHLKSIVLYGGEEKQRYIHGHVPTKNRQKKKIEYIYLPQVYNEKKKRRRRSL